MSNKTISINPNLFTIGKTKTKKNIDKKTKISQKPFISPNILKNKLLKRIKEHKYKETQGLSGKNNEKDISFKSNYNENNIDNYLKSYSDEFNDSINYLQTLSKEKKNNAYKETYNSHKNKLKQEIESKTVKNYSSSNEPFVNINLPEDLQNPLLTVNKETFVSNDNNSMHINRNYDIVPYGILKGGTKPTYRDWNKTQRNLDATNPNYSLLIQGNNTSINVERENRLHNLREKLKQKKSINTSNELMMNKNLIQKPKIIDTEEIIPTRETSSKNLEHLNRDVNKIDIKQNESNNSNNSNNSNKLIKRTIKRKYTLGKSKIKKSVSVLIKSRETRKKIITAQKDIKKKSINEIKNLLREHNLIKVGSNAPNDVLRKIYESAMLAGEITNTNSEILIHNLTKDDKIV